MFGPLYGSLGALGVSRRRAVQDAWTPATEGSALKLWLRADDLAIADGGVVASWVDAAPAPSTISLSASLPTFETNERGSKPVVRFNGTSQWARVHAVTPFNSQFGTALMAFRWRTGFASYDSPMMFASTNNWGDGWGFYVESGQLKYYVDKWDAAGRGGRVGVSIPSEGTWCFVSATHRSTGMRISLNGSVATNAYTGGLVTTVNPAAGDNAYPLVASGSTASDSYKAPIDLGEVAFFNFGMNDAALAVAESYMAERWAA